MKTVTIENQKFEIITYPYGIRVCEETVGSRYRVSAFFKTIEQAHAKILEWSEN